MAWWCLAYRPVNTVEKFQPQVFGSNAAMQAALTYLLMVRSSKKWFMITVGSSGVQSESHSSGAPASAS